MRIRQPLGLDELMIVNPGRWGLGAVFLGEDESPDHVDGLGHFFLGEDGALYRLEGHVWLGDDGALYEVVG
jgi:hypothetical protein